MASNRVRLIAAAALAAAAGPLAAQSPPIHQSASSFEVLAPRRLALPQLPFGGEAQEVPAGFFSPASKPPPSPNPAPPAAPAPTAQPQGVNMMPLFGRPQPPQPHPVAQPMFGAVPGAPWRWHGYGSVAPGNTQPLPPNVITTAPPNPGLSGIEVAAPIVLPSPTPMAQPMPVGPSLPVFPGPSAPSRPTPLAPAAVPLPSYTPPVEAVPMPGPTPAGDAHWKPSPGRVGFAPASFSASTGVEPVAFRPSRSADRAVSLATFVPTPPPTPPPPPTAKTSGDDSLVALRSTIETICAGRGRDLDMYFRSPNHLLIRMAVRQPADAERLANLISKLPELAPYHVVFEMAIAP